MHRWLRKSRQLNRHKNPRPSTTSRRKLAPDQERELLDMVDRRPGLTLAFIAKNALESYGIAVWYHISWPGIRSLGRKGQKWTSIISTNFVWHTYTTSGKFIRRYFVPLMRHLLCLTLLQPMVGLREVRELSYVSQAREPWHASSYYVFVPSAFWIGVYGVALCIVKCSLSSWADYRTALPWCLIMFGSIMLHALWGGRAFLP